VLGWKSEDLALKVECLLSLTWVGVVDLLLPANLTPHFFLDDSGKKNTFLFADDILVLLN
jgi:hypothetical protein